MPYRLPTAVVALVSGCFLVQNCDAAAPVPTSPATFPPDQVEYFEKQVRPLLVQHCVECHGPDQQEAGLRLDSRSHILKGVEGHPAAVPGDPGKSLIIAVTKYDGDVQMPPDGKLPPDQLAVLTNWVKIGMPWPEEKPAASTAVTNSPTAPATAANPWSGSMDERVARARQEHWAFQPVRRVAPAPVADPRWNTNPIDRFVYGKLAEKGLQPSPPADPRTLIRRATFDLIGLPPTAEEVDAFVSGGSLSPGLPVSRSGQADKETGRPGDGESSYKALIEALLASPHYGERWARHWLDVARYGDTKGYAFQQERRFPFAYTYRDYVIRAFNDDKPYDQFVLEQLAADKLPEPRDPKSLAALGFLTCGRQFTGIHDTIDDQIDVVTRGLLGLTVGCARCHDHKFDPLPTDDYYSLYGVFRSSVAPAEYPLLGEPEPSPEYDAYQKELAKLSAERDAFVNQEKARLLDELRTHATDYLGKIVLDQLDKAASKEKDFLFDAGDPRPTIVRKWRDYLTRTKREKTPLFTAWHRYDAVPEAEFEKLAPALTAELTATGPGAKSAVANRLLREALAKQPPKSMFDVARVYGAALEQVYADWKKLTDDKSRPAGSPAPTQLPDPAAEELRLVLMGPNTPVSIVGDESRQLFDRKVRGQVDTLQKKVDQLVVTSAGAPPRAMSLVDDANLYNPAVFIRGDAGRRGKDVPRQNLRILDEGRKPFADGSGRLGLARAIVDPGNPLTARVMVNRIWQHHFGQGLVDTPSDFGVRTPPPSHPELLDWLAAEFMQEGWSVKHLHRLIMTSETYRQAGGQGTGNRGESQAVAASDPSKIDPENRLLWRQNRRRLDLEPMRDALFAVAGQLDEKQFGRPVELWKAPFTARRAVYGYIDRQDLPGIFGVFDFANPDVTIDQRPRTTVPQQALFAMNSPLVQQQARAVANRADVLRCNSAAERIAATYRAVLGRNPSADEVARVERFLADVQTAPPPQQTWQYGYGRVTDDGKVEGFTLLKHWTGKTWQVGAKYPDDKLGHLTLRPDSGHAGRTDATAIIRWASPLDGVVALDGALTHENKEGDGVGLVVVSGRLGKLGEWTSHNGTQRTKVDRIEVRRGDVIDMVIVPLKTGNHDSFRLDPKFTLVEPMRPQAWSYSKEFHGPTSPSMTPWEMLAQVLMMSNEFVFVD